MCNVNRPWKVDSLGYTLHKDLTGPRAGLDAVEKRNVFVSVGERRPILHHQARSLDTILTRISRNMSLQELHLSVPFCQSVELSALHKLAKLVVLHAVG